MAHLQKLYSMISSTLFHNAILKAVFDAIRKECFFSLSNDFFISNICTYLLTREQKTKRRTLTNRQCAGYRRTNRRRRFEFRLNFNAEQLIFAESFSLSHSLRVFYLHFFSIILIE